MISRSIAFVTPWPPGVMGIGETCYALVKQLSQISSWRFSVYTNTPNPTQIPGVSVHTLPLNEKGVIDIGAAVLLFSQHDLIVHQMGNSSAHVFQWLLLQAFPSVCHFHDLIYHRFWAWYYFRFIKKPLTYFRELFRVYPELEHRFVWKYRRIWQHVDLQDYPFFEPHVEKSIGCIVHSEDNKRRIEKAFPAQSVYKICLHKGSLASTGAHQPSDRLHFGIFGSVIPNKRVDLIFNAFAELDREFPHWRITLVGPVAKECHSLYKLVKKLGIEKKVTFMGKVDKESYLQQLQQMDCCINLRCPSYGESSGVVTECLILGIPVLVTDLMWYSELPSFVDKIHPKDLQRELFATLRQYFLHPEVLTEKRKLSQHYAGEHLSYLEWVKNYLRILNELCLKKNDLLKHPARLV